MNSEIKRTPVSFVGAEGNTLVGDSYRPIGAPEGVALLLHGGGQTRHSWRGTAKALAAAGILAIDFDQRGHGESDWVASGDYRFGAYAEDLLSVCEQVEADTGTKPMVIGASLGGIAAMIAAGEHPDAPIAAVVLVDITPRVNPEGVNRILGFMAAHSEAGFASLEEAADAIAAYLPHRPRPTDRTGLAKNLRLGEDGRYRWHWDPRFLSSRRDAIEHTNSIQARLKAAAQGIRQPLLLVRGRESELVGEAEMQEFFSLVPHAKLADVSGARHMVVGDKNDVFTQAVTEFIGAQK